MSADPDTDLPGRESRAQLVTRKLDLLEALRILEEDYREGTVDETAYRAARDRYEAEAARVLRDLDALPDDVAGRPAGAPARRTWLTPLAALAAVAVGMAIIFFLVAALHPRSGTETVSGSGGRPAATPAPTVSPRIAADQRAVLAHPRSADAMLQLGSDYLAAGDAVAADRSFQAAMRAAPDRPEPKTLHAMVVAAAGHAAAAHALLREVERTHPRYARAWLLDGLLEAHNRRTYPRAIADWQRFLSLQPHGPLARDVRGWIRSLR